MDTVREDIYTNAYETANSWDGYDTTEHYDDLDDMSECLLDRVNYKIVCENGILYEERMGIAAKLYFCAS